jgi:Ca2+-binding EF-hand superfamily protein
VLVGALLLVSLTPLVVLAAPDWQGSESQGSARERGQAAETRLRDMDRDNDGVITRSEWLGSSRGFRRFDRNGDGVLSGEEVLRPGNQPDDSEAQELGEIFSRVDRDRSGRIERREWYGSDLAFTRLDGDEDGSISRGEFLGLPVGTSGREAFAQRDRNRNGVITPSEWNDDPEEFRRRDTDGDGVLTREEYRQDLDSSERESAAYKAGRERGLADGRQAGRGDRAANRWDPDGQREMETADAGYSPAVGSREDYQRGYRAGFQVGYREGFGPRR